MNLKTFAAFIASTLVLSGCQTITENEPPQTQPPSAPVIVPVILNPVTIPIPGGGALPSPSPTPTPAAPEPPQARGCGVGPGSGSGHGCPRQSPSFLKEVESAMDQLVREEPSLFDERRTRGCGNCYLVLNPTRYVTRMAELMAERSLCGHYDGEELAVKQSNAFNDQYDILTSDMYVRRQLGSYRSTCYPAWF
jgi:hypothetical protein